MIGGEVSKVDRECRKTTHKIRKNEGVLVVDSSKKSS